MNIFYPDQVDFYVHSTNRDSFLSNCDSCNSRNLQPVNSSHLNSCISDNSNYPDSSQSHRFSLELSNNAELDNILHENFDELATEHQYLLGHLSIKENVEKYPDVLNIPREQTRFHIPINENDAVSYGPSPLLSHPSESFDFGTQVLGNSSSFVAEHNHDDAYSDDLPILATHNASYDLHGDNEFDYYFHPEPDRRYDIYPSIRPIKGSNWSYIRDFEQDRKYQKAAILGRSTVGLKNADGEVCSGWILGGNYIMTSAHCRTPNPGVVYFGMILPWQCPNYHWQLDKLKTDPMLVTSGIFSNSDQYIERRLEKLGFPPAAIATLGKREFERLKKFSCPISTTYYNRADGCLDIDLYECPEVDVQYRLFGIDEKISLSINDLFGSISPAPKSTTFHKTIGREVYGLSVNKRNSNEREGVLLSPDGKITHTSNRDFAHPLHIIKGSSGGPIIDFSTNTAIGVHSWSAITKHAANLPKRMYSTLSDIGTGYTDKFLPYKILSPTYGIIIRNSSYQGGTQGSLHKLRCPFGTLAAGIVGSTIEGNSLDWVGNLGLICLPFTDQYAFESATVVAGGSIDTRLGQTSMTFDRYISTVLSNQAPFRQFIDADFFGSTLRFYNLLKEQQFAMCPPKYYLKGIWSLPGRAAGLTLIQSVRALVCERYDKSVTMLQPISPPIGSKTGGNFAGPVYCPPGFMVDGIDIRSGWYTDGYRLRCRGLAK